MYNHVAAIAVTILLHVSLDMYVITMYGILMSVDEWKDKSKAAILFDI